MIIVVNEHRLRMSIYSHFLAPCHIKARNKCDFTVARILRNVKSIKAPSYIAKDP